MPHIEVDDQTYRALELLAVAWDTTITDVVARLITAASTGTVLRRTHPSSSPAQQHTLDSEPASRLTGAEPTR